MHSPQQTTTKAKPTATRIMKCQNRATVLTIRWVPAFARMTKIRKEKAELSSAAKNKKLSTPPPRHQLSFPRMRGSIHPHMSEAAFGNVLTATNNDESEANSNNEARKTSHDARYTMGPRFREDDSVRELIRTTSNTNNKALKPSHGARYTMGPRVREDDKNKKRKSRAKFSGKEHKTQHTAATPPTVIPAHAGIHSSARARSRVWKRAHHDRQRQKRNQPQHG